MPTIDERDDPKIMGVERFDTDGFIERVTLTELWNEKTRKARIAYSERQQREAEEFIKRRQERERAELERVKRIKKVLRDHGIRLRLKFTEWNEVRLEVDGKTLLDENEFEIDMFDDDAAKWD